MRLRTAITIGTLALALAPVMAMGAPAALLRIDGSAVPVHESTRIVQTAAGPARVSTWSWQGPRERGRIVVRTTTGGAPPAWALRQMRDMQREMNAMQAQFAQLDRVMLTGQLALPLPRWTVFAPPMRIVMPATAPVDLPRTHRAPRTVPGVHV